MSPNVHLPEPVLGMNKTLGNEQVASGGGVYMGHPILITDDLDLAVESDDFHLTVNRRERTTG